jgi:hypothetical protein
MPMVATIIVYLSGNGGNVMNSNSIVTSVDIIQPNNPIKVGCLSVINSSCNREQLLLLLPMLQAIRQSDLLLIANQILGLRYL